VGKTKTIQVELGTDWGVEDIASEERAAYASQVLAALESDYPDADIEVTHGALVQRIDVDGIDARDVSRVVDAVWDRGGFWQSRDMPAPTIATTYRITIEMIFTADPHAAQAVEVAVDDLLDDGTIQDRIIATLDDERVDVSSVQFTSATCRLAAKDETA
jgi:hypothetical protein